MIDRNEFVNRCIGELHSLAGEHGFCEISMETLKAIIEGYVKKYKPPRFPGKPIPHASVRPINDLATSVEAIEDNLRTLNSNYGSNIIPFRKPTK